MKELILFRIFGAAALVAVLMGCPQEEEPPETNACNVHSDCEKDHVCVWGTCIPKGPVQELEPADGGVAAVTDAGAASLAMDAGDALSTDAGMELPTDAGVEIAADAGGANPTTDSGVALFPPTTSDSGPNITHTGQLSDAGIQNTGSTPFPGVDSGMPASTPVDAGTEPEPLSNFEWVLNADFEYTTDGMPTDWSVIPEDLTVYSVESDPSRGNVMQITRTGSEGSGHIALLRQNNPKWVNGCSSLVLSGYVRPISQTLPGGGWNSGEFPVQIIIYYDDVTGARHTFQMGFYYLEDVDSVLAEHGKSDFDCPEGYGTCLPLDHYNIPQDIWYAIPDVDLLALDPIPHKLEAILVGSGGWDFGAKFDSIQVKGSTTASCGTDEELGN